LDVEILDDRVADGFAHNEEMIGPFTVSEESVRVFNVGKDYFATPPFEPKPSHHADPLPSMIASGSAVMVMLVPPTLIIS
jgi:hypothetical protein